MRSLSASLLAVLVVLAGVPGASAEDPPAPPAIPAAPAAGKPPADPGPEPLPYLTISGARLNGVSRDGETVVVRMTRDSVTQLFRTTGDGGWPHRLTFRQDGVDFSSLSPDGTKAIVGWDVNGDENYGLYLVSTSGPEAAKPLSIQPKVRREDVVWSREGDRFYFRDNADGEADFHLREMTIADGSVRTVLARSGDWVVTDVAPGAKRLLVMHSRSNFNASIHVLDVATGALAEIDKAPEGSTYAPDGAQFLGAGDEAAFSSDRGGNWRRPYVVSLADGKVRPLIEGDAAKAGPDVEEMAATADGKTVYVVWNEGGRGRVAGFATATGASVPAPDVGDGIANDLVVDDAGRVFFTLGSSDEPGAVVRWDPGTPGTTLNPLTFADMNGLPAAAFPAKPKAVSYPTFDGKEIPAWLYLPHGAEDAATRAKKLPFIVHFHGGPEGQERPYFSPDRAFLLSQGFAVLAPNVRGSTGFGKTWRDLDNYKLRLDSVRDGKAAADWLVKAGYADAKRIATWGGSYGGYMVLAELTEFPGTFAAGIEVVGISNFETFLENTASYRRALREAEYGPLSDREFLRSISPIHKVEAITAPLLVCQGEQDPRVPVAEARQIEKALKDLKRPVQSLYFKDEGHGFSRRDNRRVYLRTMVQFLKQYIGG